MKKKLKCEVLQLGNILLVNIVDKKLTFYAEVGSKVCDLYSNNKKVGHMESKKEIEGLEDLKGIVNFYFTYSYNNYLERLMVLN